MFRMRAACQSYLDEPRRDFRNLHQRPKWEDREDFCPAFDRLADEARDIAVVLSGTYHDDRITREYANRISSILRKHGVRLS